jgi:hypothetical protein
MTNINTAENLSEYPSLIRQLELELFDYGYEKRGVEQQIDLFNAELELEIANDLSLRNEQARKAQKVISQQTSKEYQGMNEALETLQGRAWRSQILLECRKREFSVLKLERQLEIARMQEVAA